MFWYYYKTLKKTHWNQRKPWNKAQVYFKLLFY